MRQKFCIGMALCMVLGTAAVAGGADGSGEQVSNDKVFANDPVGINIPTIITITRPDDLEPRTDWVEPVRFYHAMHATQHACFDCHHEETNTYMGEDRDGFTPCTDCHADEGMLEPLSFYAAWHAKSPISCVGCHWQHHLKGDSVPPISCTRGCHPNAKLTSETIKHTAHSMVQPENMTTKPSKADASTAPSSAHATSSSQAPNIAWEVAPRQQSKTAHATASSLSPAKDLKE